jgi:hypothetical protein
VCCCCCQGFESIIKGKYLSGHDKAHKATIQKYNISTDGRKPEQVRHMFQPMVTEPLLTTLPF